MLSQGFTHKTLSKKAIQSWSLLVLKAAKKVWAIFGFFSKFDMACLLSKDGKLDWWIDQYLKELSTMHEQTMHAMSEVVRK